ncbi:hypothetical protein [Dendronalium sp. ChiSLP03b]|uniref:hypothetical protein n=1 Tax=Dendronalium sp. ChiSLP03b TaxID=3075381 RepID=UPI00391BD9F2
MTRSQLVSEASYLLIEIRQHPDLKALIYHPNCHIGDTVQAVNELCYELGSTVDTTKFEDFYD